MSEPAPIALVVDDEAPNLRLLAHLLGRAGWHIIEAQTAAEAATIAAGPPPDMVLIDRLLPDGEGLELMSRLRTDPRYRGVPMVLQTAMTDTQAIVDGLDAGAFYYLTKPFEPAVLLAVARSALFERRRRQDLAGRIASEAAVFGLMSTGSLIFRTIEQARTVAGALANLHPEPDRIGPGLLELLVNAVEHGNLGIGYEQKGALLRGEAFHAEVRRRLSLPEHRHKVVRVRFERSASGVMWHIRDQGDGFDPDRFLSFEPERAFELHGRGIAMAMAGSLDNVRYIGPGNEVMATALIVDTSSVADRLAPPVGGT